VKASGRDGIQQTHCSRRRQSSAGASGYLQKPWKWLNVNNLRFHRRQTTTPCCTAPKELSIRLKII
jgi:hypothetical protein